MEWRDRSRCHTKRPGEEGEGLSKEERNRTVIYWLYKYDFLVKALVAEDIFPESIEESDDDAEFIDPDVDEDFLSEDEESPKPYGFTWKFDFNKGDISFDESGNTKVLEGQDTVREWMAHTLNTERYETTIFGGDIGTDINSLIGTLHAADSDTISEVESQIREAVLVHDRVESIERLVIFPFEDDIFAYFKYVTDDGAESEEVVGF